MAERRTASFSPELARLIADYVRAELGITPAPSNRASGRIPARERTYARIGESADDAGTIRHAWTEQRWSYADDAWEDVPDGKTGTTTDNYVVCSVPTVELRDGSIVEVSRAEDPETGANCWVRLLPTGIFLVALEQDGGASGSDGSTCSWTYTAKDADDTSIELATELAPIQRRINNVEYTNNSSEESGDDYGLARYSAGGSLVLLSVLTEAPLFDADCAAGGS